MTKKDYTLLTRVLKQHLSIFHEEFAHAVICVLGNAIAYELAKDNAAFKKNKFLRACGINE